MSDHSFKLWHEKCTLRQMIHDGNFEDHEALIKLSGLALSYPSWQTDFDEALSYLKDEGYHPFLGLRRPYQGYEKQTSNL